MDDNKKNHNSVREVEFGDFGITKENEDEKVDVNIEELSAIVLELKVLLGQANLTLEEIESLKEGDTIDLDKLSGELLDIYIGNEKIGRSEIIVLDPNDEEFSTVISEITASKRELLKKIKKNGEL